MICAAIWARCCSGTNFVSIALIVFVDGSKAMLRAGLSGPQPSTVT